MQTLKFTHGYHIRLFTWVTKVPWLLYITHLTPFTNNEKDEDTFKPRNTMKSSNHEKEKTFQPRELQILRCKRKCQSCSGRKIRKCFFFAQVFTISWFSYSIYYEYRCYRELSITTIFLGGSINV